MNEFKITTVHPLESELADFLSGVSSASERSRMENHIASCEDCLAKIISAHETVKNCNTSRNRDKEKGFKKMNIYLAFAVISFIMSFAVPRYFIQFLVATLILGFKWITDSKSTKMLVMIYEAWKSGGEKEASRIIQNLDQKNKIRF
ncbi:MAG TPA: zf-HC2 domain-containing protein [Candidatus Omnitrophota bacterium]|nr:zf-HC2 domain-containing protein [Candidatus Omnitrophota bacterium]